MSNILIIVGLPGSGKTKLAEKINEDNGYKYRLLDDPTNFDKDIRPYLGEDLIITDPHLCFEKNRTKCEEMIKNVDSTIKIDWIFFENDPEKCLVNSNNRSKKVSSFIQNYSKFYTIPEGANVVKVFSA